MTPPVCGNVPGEGALAGQNAGSSAPVTPFKDSI
jgi:hypothetical protein